MEYEELIKSNSSAKKISSDQLGNIINSEDKQYLKYSNDEAVIYIENHIIEDEYISFGASLQLNFRLTFKDCFFLCKRFVFINGMVCKNYVTFENCYFTNGIYINEGVFAKELVFKLIHSRSFTINGGTFQKISLSGYDLKEVTLSGGKFESFNFGEYVAQDNIGSLIIINKPGELGDIDITNKYFDKIFINGTNKDRVYNFNNIKCDHFPINNFINKGSLNIFSVEPKDPSNENVYFEITKSNLDKAQFYRANFSMYKELVVIDSYISNCLFFGCQWRNNIRALSGSSSFEESSENNRKINKEERYKILEAYRQLKTSMKIYNDKIQEAKFYSREMTIHSKLLKWSGPWQNSFWDKLILYIGVGFSAITDKVFLNHFFFFWLGISY